MNNIELKNYIKQLLGINYIDNKTDKYLYKNINSIGNFTIINFCKLFNIRLDSLKVDYPIEIDQEMYLDTERLFNEEVVSSKVNFKPDFTKLKNDYRKLNKKNCIGYTNWCTLDQSYNYIPSFIVGKKNYKEITLENSSVEDYQNSLIYVMYRNDGIISITGRMNHEYPNTPNTDFYISINKLLDLIGNITEENPEKLKVKSVYRNNVAPENTYPNIYSAYTKIKIIDMALDIIKDKLVSSKTFYISDHLKTLRKRMFANTSFDKIVIPDYVTKINRRCFENSKVTKINIPKFIEKIEPFAFYGTKIETPLVIPNTIKNFDIKIFYNIKCKKITLPDNLKVLDIKGFGVFTEKLIISKNTEVIQNLSNPQKKLIKMTYY